MSNSKHICYTKLSPNCNKPRNHVIDTITIHHMAGNCTVEVCGAIFAPVTRQASSNYGIDSKGRIGMYVEECNRSWCSSSGANDHRAITIEVANDSGNPDWHVSDEAIESLIVLCTDICKRNPNITNLKWMDDKSLIGNVDKQNMTIHQWFSATGCPGPYLKSKLKYVADEVNKRLIPQNTPVKKITVTVNNDEVIWKYLKGKKLTDTVIAGIMGNLYAESGLVPKNLQNTFESMLGMNDDQYTEAVDNGSYSNFGKDKAGYGLAQWTYYTRKQALQKYAKTNKKSIGDINLQLDFLWKELNSTFKTMMAKLIKTTTVKEASDLFLYEFERPAKRDTAVSTKRALYGQKYYDKYATKQPATNTTTAFKPYIVMSAIDVLNYREGPGTEYKVRGTIRKNVKYTITEERISTYGSPWGKLKSGAGWISLKYTKKV